MFTYLLNKAPELTKESYKLSSLKMPTVKVSQEKPLINLNVYTSTENFSNQVCFQEERI